MLSEHMEVVTVPAAPNSVDTFESLHSKGTAAGRQGDFEGAVVALEAARKVAERSGDYISADRAECDRCACLITLGFDLVEVIKGLRSVLLRAGDHQNGFFAAYNLARVHESIGSGTKGFFYARQALDRARILENPDWTTWALNQIGNFLVASSRFEEAIEYYGEALSLLPEHHSPEGAAIYGNLGYCHFVAGDLDQGFHLVFRCLRWQRSFQLKHYEVWPHLDLCYGYLEAGRPDRARQHGLRALGLAEELDDPDRVKASLFLLAETENEAGDSEKASQYFARLQRDFYPGQAQLFTSTHVSLRNIVNLRALA